MKLQTNKNQVIIAGKPSEYSKMEAVANEMIKMGYEDTQTGDEDDGYGEAWIILQNDGTIAEAKEDYKLAKERAAK